jgi:hypothetical protein
MNYELENDFPQEVETEVTDNQIADYIRAELDDDIPFEEILEDFDLTPEEVFVFLFNSGKIDPETLEARLLDFE